MFARSTASFAPSPISAHLGNARRPKPVSAAVPSYQGRVPGVGLDLMRRGVDLDRAPSAAWDCMNSFTWLKEKALVTDAALDPSPLAFEQALRGGDTHAIEQMATALAEQVEGHMGALFTVFLRPASSGAATPHARWQLVEAMAGMLIDDDGGFNPCALPALRQALQENAVLDALGPTSARHILFRLDQLEADARLPEAIESIAWTPANEIHGASMPLVEAQTRLFDHRGPTPHDLGVMALSALLDTARQHNAPNCWEVARKIQTTESDPLRVLQVIRHMLRHGTTEVGESAFGRVEMAPCEVPIDQPDAWKVKLRITELSVDVLREHCPSVFCVARRLDLDDDELVELLRECASDAKGRFITLGNLVFAMALKLRMTPEQLDEMSNRMAAQERNVLLAAWLQTLTIRAQFALNKGLVEDILRTFEELGRPLPPVAREKLMTVFATDARYLLDADIDGDRLQLLGLIARGPKHPRVNADNAASFTRLVLEALDRVEAQSLPPAARMQRGQKLRAGRRQPESPLRQALASAREATRHPHFCVLVTQRHRNRLDPGSNGEPWQLEGWYAHAQKKDVHVGPPLVGKNVEALSLEFPDSDEVHVMDIKLPASSKQVDGATLSGWLGMTRALHGHPGRRHLLDRSMGQPLLATANHHTFRLLPSHDSWVDGWQDSTLSVEAWVDQHVVQPARAAGAQPRPRREVERMLMSLLDQVVLTKGASPESVVAEALRTCRTRRGPNGTVSYRLDDAVRHLSHTLRSAVDDKGRRWCKQINIQKKLAAGLRLLPEMRGRMVVLGDSNHEADRNRRGVTAPEPLMCGVAYDIMGRRLRSFLLIEGPGNRPRWCDAN